MANDVTEAIETHTGRASTLRLMDRILDGYLDGLLPEATARRFFTRLAYILREERWDG